MKFRVYGLSDDGHFTANLSGRAGQVRLCNHQQILVMKSCSALSALATSNWQSIKRILHIFILAFRFLFAGCVVKWEWWHLGGCGLVNDYCAGGEVARRRWGWKPKQDSGVSIAIAHPKAAHIDTLAGDGKFHSHADSHRWWCSIQFNYRVRDHRDDGSLS